MTTTVSQTTDASLTLRMTTTTLSMTRRVFQHPVSSVIIWLAAARVPQQAGVNVRL
jgi:hypothetical protein